MLKWVTYLSIVLMFTACYKDDVVIEDLTYNMFDPGYIGPAFIEVIAVGLQENPVDTFHQVLNIKVKSELFPNTTTYSLFVECLNDSSVEEIIQQPPDIHEFTYIKPNVEQGTEYCYDLSLRVEYSNTRRDEHCYTAQ